MKQWFSDMQKDFYVLGPLLPHGSVIETQNGEKGASVDIETFLGKMLVQYGKRSVFFVRFFLSSALHLKINFSDFVWHSLLSLGFGIR
jgi:hypothetical protein